MFVAALLVINAFELLPVDVAHGTLRVETIAMLILIGALAIAAWAISRVVRRDPRSIDPHQNPMVPRRYGEFVQVHAKSMACPKRSGDRILTLASTGMPRGSRLEVVDTGHTFESGSVGIGFAALGWFHDLIGAPIRLARRSGW